MTTKRSVAKPAQDQFEDELDLFVEESKQDPAFRAAYEDSEELHRLLDTLIGLRRAHGLSQTAVAQRMNVRQPTISGFETEGSDPRLSTLQRYARAVHARLRLRVDLPAECDWVSPSTVTYVDGSAASVAKSSVRGSDQTVRGWSKRDPRDDQWSLTA